MRAFVRVKGIGFGLCLAASAFAQQNVQHADDGPLSEEDSYFELGGDLSARPADTEAEQDFLHFDNLRDARKGMYAILQKLNATLNPNLSDATVKAIRGTSKLTDADIKGNVASAHWMREKVGAAQGLRNSAEWTAAQRNYFMTALGALSDQEKAFLAMTMTAYGRENATANSANCPATLNASSSDEARLRCFNDARSRSAMQAQMKKLFAAGDGADNAPSAIFDNIIRQGDWSSGALGGLPEMLRGLASSMDNPSPQRLGRDKQALGFERAMQAYIDASNEQTQLAPDAIQTPLVEMVPIEDAHGSAEASPPPPKTLLGKVSTGVQKIIKKVENEAVQIPRKAVDFVQHPIKSLKGRRADHPGVDLSGKSGQSPESLTKAVEDLMSDTRADLADKLGADLWRRINDDCRGHGNLTAEDNRQIRAAVRGLGTSPLPQFDGYSTRDIFAFTSTAFSEAKSQQGSDRTIDNPQVRVEMLATMFVMKNRSYNYILKYPFEPPTIFGVASERRPIMKTVVVKNSRGEVMKDFRGRPVTKRVPTGRYGYQFSGWNHSDPNFACLIAGPAAGVEAMGHRRSMRAFVDLIDSRTRFAGDFGNSTNYFQVGTPYGTLLRNPIIYLEDHSTTPMRPKLHNYGNGVYLHQRERVGI